MELKTNYQYTYFIHPFIIKENRYRNYLIKMLKDRNCKLKTFEKVKDFKMYKYFLPKIRDLLFSSFGLGNAKIKQLEELPIDTRAAILSKYQCNIFEYNLEKDIQAKIDDENDNGRGIYFSINKINIICFNTGICFLCIKTNLDEESSFENVLNFNYKFREINSKSYDLANYDKIKIQTDSFSNVETFRNFIEYITGSSNLIQDLNIDIDRFLTYSYACIDQKSWNNESGFDKIANQFIKFSNNLSADNSINFNEHSTEIFSKWKYAEIGLTKSAISLFSSTYDINNYTILPYEYENQYFYTYIINLYKKIYLEKLINEVRKSDKIKKLRKNFSEFTKKIWIQEITEDHIGTMLNKEMIKILELEDLYKNVKNKYDILYKELNIGKTIKVNIWVMIIFMASLMLNIYNFIIINKR